MKVQFVLLLFLRQSLCLIQATNNSGLLPDTCNGHQELCARRYSNITYITTHNSPFHQRGNPARNQDKSIEQQLGDGIRSCGFESPRTGQFANKTLTVQVQAHWHNGAIRMCHTDCFILDAGPLEEFFSTLGQWLANNPFEILTIVIGNADLLTPKNFSIPLINSGLSDAVYKPPKGPMELGDWPTLGSMIRNNSRVVVMLDYTPAGETPEEESGYFFDEFKVVWETQLSPTTTDFPCSPHRPPNQSWEERQDRLFMMNHNLNVGFVIGNTQLLVPAISSIDETNAQTGDGSLGLAVERCIIEWHRPPNFLLVDFYEQAKFSVLEVAAQANGLKWIPPRATNTGQYSSILWKPWKYLLLTAITIILFNQM